MKNMPPPVAVKSKLLDSPPSKKGGKKNVDFVAKKQPVCPKPLRPVSSVPEVISSLRCSKHRNSCLPNDVILNLTDSRVISPGHNRNDHGHDQASCTGCSTPYYSGSPPGRTNNPLIYDAEFVHQMEMLSPFSCKNLQEKSSFTSASPV